MSIFTSKKTSGLLARHAGLFIFFLGFCLTSVACCVGVQSVGTLAPEGTSATNGYMPPTQIDDALTATVAFVNPRTPMVEGQQTLASEDYELPYCAGFFVGTTRIVSAAHCFQPTVRIPLPDGTMVPIALQTNPEGRVVSFVRYGQIDMYRQRVVQQPQSARVAYYDQANDTVVLELLDNVAPARHHFRFAAHAPNVGEHVFNVGHPQTMVFTFSDGMVSRVIRPEPHGEAVIIQATNPTVGGCSGGPLFNQQGEIIGMADAYIGRVPQLGIFIAADRIHEAVRASIYRNILARLSQNGKTHATQQQGQQQSGTLETPHFDGGTRNRY